MKILFTQHAKVKMKKRKIDKKTIYVIVNKPQEEYFDTQQKSFVRISKVTNNGKTRKISVFFLYEGENVKIKTMHPESDQEIKNRKLTGRYI